MAISCRQRITAVCARRSFKGKIFMRKNRRNTTFQSFSTLSPLSILLSTYRPVIVVPNVIQKSNQLHDRYRLCSTVYEIIITQSPSGTLTFSDAFWKRSAYSIVFFKEELIPPPKKKNTQQNPVLLVYKRRSKKRQPHRCHSSNAWKFAVAFDYLSTRVSLKVNSRRRRRAPADRGRLASHNAVTVSNIPMPPVYYLLRLYCCYSFVRFCNFVLKVSKNYNHSEH